MKVFIRSIIIMAFVTGVSYAAMSGDPGSDFGSAKEITPGTYRETLDSTDQIDFYKFKVKTRDTVTLILTSPSGSDFDLQLYNAAQVSVANSVNPEGKRDIVGAVVDTAGYWYAEVVQYEGKGEYTLEFQKDSIEPVWTVMIYLNADNNLESFGYSDFNEMEQVGSNAYTNVVVQFDTKSGPVKRYFVKKDNNTSSITSPVVDNPGELDMGDGHTLANFVSWAVRKYPAKHYALDIWDHGSGWHKKGTGDELSGPVKGVSQDESSNYDMIGISSGELKGALSSIKSTIGKKLDVLGFDACLMGMWEVLDNIKDYADYAVASEQTEAADGWYYAGWLNIGPNTTGHDIAVNIVNSQQGLATLAAIDLSKIPELSTKIDTFAKALINQRPQNSALIDTARAHFWEDGSGSYDHEYGWESGQLSNYHEDIDLYQFAQYISNTSGLPDAVRHLASDVMTAVNNAVITTNNSNDYRGDSHGISIYYPKNKNDYNHSIFGGNYDALPTSKHTHWDEFVKGEEGGANYDYTLSSGTYNWINTSTATGVTGDDQSKNISLPFTFTFYGVNYNSVNICSNGFLSFTSTSTAYNPQSIPNSSAPNALIAPFWRDLNPSAAGRITYSSSSSRFVVTFDGVKNYRTDNKETFQVILYPNGEIVFQYKTIDNDVTTVIGIEDENGSKGKTANFPSANTAYRFVPTSKDILAANTGLSGGLSMNTVARDRLNIRFGRALERGVNLSIIDITGRRVKEYRAMEGIREISLNVGTLRPGVYFLKSDADMGVRKFVKIH